MKYNSLQLFKKLVSYFYCELREIRANFVGKIETRVVNSITKEGCMEPVDKGVAFLHDHVRLHVTCQ